jgi:F-type H+-transporting ATPase subunit a
MAGHAESPLSHVIDHPTIEIPWFSGPHFELSIELWKIGGFQITRLMVMEVIAGLLMLGVLIPVVQHIRRTGS